MPDSHKNCETAWAAGLFEGEGCIHVGTQKGRWPRVVLTLGMTDRDVVERFALFAEVGAIHIRQSTRPEWAEFYAWSVAGKKAESVLRAMLPWLGERRSAKAREALLAIARIGVSNSDKTQCPQGHPYDETNTAYNRDGSRRCKACMSERAKRKRSNAG